MRNKVIYMAIIALSGTVAPLTHLLIVTMLFSVSLKRVDWRYDISPPTALTSLEELKSIRVAREWKLLSCPMTIL